MPRPVTPFVGCDVFVTDAERRVLLIRRSDNGLWALPGGGQDLDETPVECAVRECREESGYEVRVTELLGVYSSKCYPYVNYPWKENRYTHILYRAEMVGGRAVTSEETTEVGWFREDEIPALSDGHEPRIRFGFATLKGTSYEPHFE